MTLAEFLSLMRSTLEGTTFEGKCYIVGGVVRDHLLGRQDFDDFDLVVEMPYGGLKLGAYLSHRWHPDYYETFPKFGTAKMETMGTKLDFVQTRKEVYRPGRRYPRITFSSIRDDVYRRDFCINALYLELFSSEISDPCGRGRQDLEQGMINSIREPDKVFAEDLLRIIRALRFSAVLGFEIGAESKTAMRKYAQQTSRLSARAIQREVGKIVAAGKLEQAKALFHEFGLELPDFPPEPIGG
ncbi:MAG: CCA tRNA nucleotidyltransferase [Candidatus Cloacimonetes bacterium]|jgi:tRNA nucleotidyltransferase/poly(A) polymerase|nr:CCA tRNA nucleotidyltransferase [Candidatus Cloacimonadota bacterium]MDD2505760.1 CCA tRNA nucleotidyltransferase [Candidatus Cloacimonadota bacterium]MDD4146902.1 CCA tRNA nucleotidyltransferase [Candidatus Cloacimonadota bacterium]MDD4559182.1 CCA tRNA nucleotidyltransferase [Candidatus Cloacimonadota bacterium]